VSDDCGTRKMVFPSTILTKPVAASTEKDCMVAIFIEQEHVSLFYKRK
jgi:hypothetical protein